MNVTVTLTASPELLEVLNKIADNFSGGAVKAISGPAPEGQKQAPVVEKIKAPQKDKVVTAAAIIAEPGAATTKEVTTTDTAVVLTREAVRAKAVPLSKAGHKDKIKKKITELGADNLDTLAEDKFPAFVEFLNTL